MIFFTLPASNWQQKKKCFVLLYEGKFWAWSWVAEPDQLQASALENNLRENNTYMVWHSSEVERKKGTFMNQKLESGVVAEEVDEYSQHNVAT